ncbi:hypothetical protein ACHQM5_000023 [Ranunculus cassubicifolius]
MDSELDMARTKIHELRAELELERKARKKVESLNKKLCKQILEERKKRETVEDVCEKLANEIASEKLVLDRVKKDIVEERKMLKMAEVFREERVQMKLTEAKIFLEEKLSELEFSKVAVAAPSKLEQSKVRSFSMNDSTTSSSIENSSSASNYNNPGFVSTTLINKRRASPEPENPHIRRGIKGFVEFPRVVRAISSRGRQLGSKVECQKAQLRLLLRQKSPFRSTENLIM